RRLFVGVVEDRADRVAGDLFAVLPLPQRVAGVVLLGLCAPRIEQAEAVFAELLVQRRSDVEPGVVVILDDEAERKLDLVAVGGRGVLEARTLRARYLAFFRHPLVHLRRQRDVDELAVDDLDPDRRPVDERAVFGFDLARGPEVVGLRQRQ